MIDDIAVKLEWNPAVNREEIKLFRKCNRLLLETTKEIEQIVIEVVIDIQASLLGRKSQTECGAAAKCIHHRFGTWWTMGMINGTNLSLLPTHGNRVSLMEPLTSDRAIPKAPL